MNSLLRRPALRWGRIIGLIAVLFAVSLVGVLAAHREDHVQTFMNKAVTPALPTATTTIDNHAAKSSFNKQQFSIDNPDSQWVIVDKRRPLQPKDYAPQLVTPNVALRLSNSADEMHVSKTMAPQLEKLFAAAETARVPLRLASGYRSYQTQVAVYNAEVKNYGQAQADRESARPGYSEHQTGLAADLEPLDRSCEVTQCFAATPQGQWLAAHAADYGFVIRYSQGKEASTGYMYEPWHIRYVGIDLAKELYNQGNPTLESFFNLPDAPGYL